MLLEQNRDGVMQKAGKSPSKMLVSFCTQSWQKERVFVALSVWHVRKVSFAAAEC